jgi:hypothetical protein
MSSRWKFTNSVPANLVGRGINFAMFARFYRSILDSKREIIYTTLIFSIFWSVLLSFGIIVIDQFYFEDTDQFTILNLSMERFLQVTHQQFGTDNILLTLFKRCITGGAIGFSFSLLAIKFRNHVAILPVLFGIVLFFVFTSLFYMTAESPEAINSINQIRLMLFVVFFPTQLCSLLVLALWYRSPQS